MFPTMRRAVSSGMRRAAGPSSARARSVSTAQPPSKPKPSAARRDKTEHLSHSAASADHRAAPAARPATPSPRPKEPVRDEAHGVFASLKSIVFGDKQVKRYRAMSREHFEELEKDKVLVSPAARKGKPSDKLSALDRISHVYHGHTGDSSYVSTASDERVAAQYADEMPAEAEPVVAEVVMKRKSICSYVTAGLFGESVAPGGTPVASVKEVSHPERFTDDIFDQR